MIDEIVAVFIEEYRMVLRKTWVSENFGPMSKSRKHFCVLGSRFFLPKDLGVLDLSFFISVWSSGVEIFQRFRV